MSEKVLVIKDDDNYAAVLKKELESLNYDVMVHEDGEDVLRIVNDYDPQIIILFAFQNKIGGYYLMKEKKEVMDKKHIPVMIVTNTEKGSQIEEAMRFGATNCILKGDFDAKEAARNISDYLKNHNPEKIKSKSNMKNKTVKQIIEDEKKKGLRILLVEDDEFLRDICKRKLEIEGFNVSVAVDGMQALKKIEEDNPQMILLDVILPGLDGFEILKTLKANPERARIPVIMLTNLGQTSEVEKGLSLGADEYIVKAHFTIGEIIEKIKTVMKKKI